MREIVLHSDDMLLLDHWQNSLKHSCQVIDTLEMLKMVSNSIVIITVSACERDCKRILEELTHNNNLLLVLDRVPDFARAKQLLDWGVKGYGNALMRDHYLVAAVETLQDNMVWLYPEFTTQLITQMDSGSKDDYEMYLQKVSDREREVALLLKEGDTYKTVAEKLGLMSLGI